MASYKDCAKKVGLSAEVDAYLRGEMDPDDPKFREHLSRKKIEAMNQAHQRKLEAVAQADAADFINGYEGSKLFGTLTEQERTVQAIRAYLTQDDMATGRTSVEDTVNAATRFYMGRLNELVGQADNRGFAKRLFSTGALADDTFNKNLMREVFGKSSGDGDAAKFAKMWREVSEDIRVQINKKGGLIRKLDDWGMPQRHLPDKMHADGKPAWVAYTAERLDLERMGLKDVGEARAMLDKVYDTIMTNGANKLDPDNLPRTGKGKLANQHREHRALHFKDADTWAEYAGKYGDGDAVGAMITHLRDMSRDLGMLTAMGPSPESVYRTMRARVAHAADMEAGATAKHPGARTNHIDNIWSDINGLGVENTKWAQFGGITRTFLSAAKLGGATVSSLPDVASTAGMVFLNGMSTTKWARTWMKQVIPGVEKAGREKAMRLGIISQQAIEDFRGASKLTEPEALGLARKTSNGFYKLSLLTQWDRANRTAYKLSLVDALSDLPTDFGANTNKQLGRLLDKHGITDGDWRKFQAAKDPSEGNMINPMRMDTQTAIKFMGMIESSSNIAVLQPTARTRAVLHQGTAPGSAKGEAFRFMGQWKSFPVAFMQARMSSMVNTAAGKHGDSAGFRAAYIGYQISSLTALGMMAVQAKEITKGRDPLAMESEADWARLMLAGAAQSGVGGLWYEAIYGMLNHGRSPVTLLAPAAAGIFDDIIVGAMFRDWDLDEMAKADQTLIDNIGAAGVRALGWVPGQSLFYVRAAWDQYVVPAVADQISDKESRRIKNRNRRIRRERGQERWIGYGEGVRAPDMFGD